MIDFIKNSSKKDRRKVGRKIKQNEKNYPTCPKCGSEKLEAFYFSFNPPVLECLDCGYTWELPFENNKAKRLFKRFCRIMQGNLDY